MAYEHDPIRRDPLDHRADYQRRNGAEPGAAGSRFWLILVAAVVALLVGIAIWGGNAPAPDGTGAPAAPQTMPVPDGGAIAPPADPAMPAPAD